MHKVAVSYASALLRLAVSKHILTEIHADMNYLKEVCATQKHFMALLKNPFISLAQKQKVLYSVFEGTLQALTLRFLTKVVQERRAPLLPTMSQTFLTQYDQHQGIKRGVLTSAFTLSDELVSQLGGIARRITPCRQLILQQHVDPTLIGGYTLRIGDQYFDHSIRKKLHTLYQHCVTAGY